MFEEAIRVSLAPHALIGFGVYILGAMLAMWLFVFFYTRITPHKEFELLRAGNTTAAVALIGSMIGFALPVHNLITYSNSILDFAIWALIAMIVQLVMFAMTGLVLKGVSARIERDELSAGIFVAGASIAAGLLNSACMVPA
jgi:putative membrane protein